MKNRFRTGEISKLYQIPIKTLRYYDPAGLFKPAIVDPISNYRYYTIEQFEMLNPLKFLWYLGYSIKDIKSHLRSKSEDGFVETFKTQIENMFDSEVTLRGLENNSRLIPSIMIGRVGLVISKDILSSGVYACIYFNAGNHDQSSGFYKKVLGYLRKNNLKISGDAIEHVIIDNCITDGPKKHITEIQIPISS